jgi:predicted MFS family arabinose efflux permease
MMSYTVNSRRGFGRAGAFFGGRMHSPSSERLTGSQWLMLLVLAGVQFTNVLDFVVMMPLAIQFQAEWHLSPREFGGLVASYAFAAAVSGLLSTWFIDRLDRKRSLLLIYAGFTMANVFCAIAPNYWVMLIARAMAGMFGGILGGTILAIIGDVIPMSRRGFATGIIMSSFSVASIVGIPFSLYLAEESSWRWTFTVLAASSAILLTVAWYRLPTFRGHLEHQVEGQNPWHNVWSLISEPNLLRAYLLMAVMIITTFMVVPYLPSYMVANVGMPQKDLKLIYLFGGLATLLIMAPVGKLADRYGKLLVFQILAALTALPMLLVTHLPPSPLFAILVVTTLLMAITSSRSVPAMALVTACTTPQKRGGFMSVLGSVNQLAMGVATMVAGLILGDMTLPEQPSLTVNPAHLLEPIKPIEGFPIVGWLSCVLTLSTIYLATHLRGADGRPINRVKGVGLSVEAAKDVPASPADVAVEIKQGV